MGMENSMNVYTSVLANNTDVTAPNFSGITNLAMEWVNPILNILYILVGIVATLVMIYYGVQAMRAKDPNERQEVMKKIGWWFLGLVIVGIAATATNIIFPIILKSGGTLNTNLLGSSNNNS